LLFADSVARMGFAEEDAIRPAIYANGQENSTVYVELG
jgi:hypothetical protein